MADGSLQAADEAFTACCRLEVRAPTPMPVTRAILIAHDRLCRVQQVDPCEDLRLLALQRQRLVCGSVRQAGRAQRARGLLRASAYPRDARGEARAMVRALRARAHAIVARATARDLGSPRRLGQREGPPRPKSAGHAFLLWKGEPLAAVVRTERGRVCSAIGRSSAVRAGKRHDHARVHRELMSNPSVACYDAAVNLLKYLNCTKEKKLVFSGTTMIPSGLSATQIRWSLRDADQE